MLKLQAVVIGKVQNVHYRAYVQDSATELGLVGSVQNLSNGSVSVVAEGMPDTLKGFIEYLNEGSLQSEVTGINVEWGTASGSFTDFSILH